MSGGLATDPLGTAVPGVTGESVGEPVEQDRRTLEQTVSDSPAAAVKVGAGSSSTVTVSG